MWLESAHKQIRRFKFSHSDPKAGLGTLERGTTASLWYLPGLRAGLGAASVKRACGRAHRRGLRPPISTQASFLEHLDLLNGYLEN